MATAELPRSRDISPTIDYQARSLAETLRFVLAPCASLRWTVTLLGFSIFLVFAGTLAQRYYDIGFVLEHCFRSWTSRLEWRWFVPGSWTTSAAWGLPFVGGKTLGTLIAINLFAAHALRFKAQARGSRLAWGLALLAVGAGVVYAVVQSGLGKSIESELSDRFVNGLWHMLRAALGGGALALAYALALSYRRMAASSERWAWWFGAAAAALLLALTGYLFTHPEARLDASGLRIMWQLIKATAASAVLWAGCRLTFGRRDGIVLLHTGVALLMLSELHTSEFAVESRVGMVEGQTVHYAEDVRSVELALVDKSDQEQDRTIAAPGNLLSSAAASQKELNDSRLPVRVSVVDYYPNANVRIAQGSEKSPASAGLGQLRVVEKMATSTGVESEQRVDLPAALVKVEGAEPSGVFLLSPVLHPESITIDGKPYELSLRFQRIDKPYEITLLKFTKEDYVGTGTPKNFESFVRLRDPSSSIDSEIAISMNNPLRYAGDTLYQSSFDPKRPNYSELQVVTNSGWMVPYVACMIVATGMLAHFGAVFWRFVRRREEEAWRQATAGQTTAEHTPVGPMSVGPTSMGPMSVGHLPINPTSMGQSPRDSTSGEAATELRGRPGASLPFWSIASWRRPAVWGPAALATLLGLWLVSKATPRREPATAMQIQKFGELPAAFGGRTQPLDSIARTTLRILSHGETFYDVDGKTTLPAITWLLDVASANDRWRDRRVFRIDNLDVREALDLKPRKGSCYSFNELGRASRVVADGASQQPNKSRDALEYDRQVRLAQQAAQNAAEDPKAALTAAQKGWLELAEKVQRVRVLLDAFGTPDFSGETREEQLQSVQILMERLQHLGRPEVAAMAPRAVLPETPEKAWETTLRAEAMAMVGGKVDDGVRLLRTILLAYGDDNVAKFNNAVADYQELVVRRAAAENDYELSRASEGNGSGRKAAERLHPQRIAFEAYYNRLSPVKICMAFYVLAFVLAAAAWLGWFEGLNRAANWTLWIAFAVHTWALACRIYLSGRPPVTNLYSSAVFIGWGAVLFALLFECVYRLGVGNLLAATIGFPTQLIAYHLAREGDTMAVMQAVLDTNFWLATHVVCISLGYTTTFLAGGLGVIWLLMDRAFGRLTPLQSSQLTRMTYGTVCFSIFFSFVGTVLGGLWADDSWGRFWGWDPKENGALMIVLWNAVVLHARWGKLVGPCGFAVLAVFGNVITSWSWFGVNQLGVGLHSYGFTSGVALALTVFVLSQLGVMTLAAWPVRKSSV